MTNPRWVGSTVIDPDDSWSLSWTVTTADLPAGTESGDLLLLWLIADAQSGESFQFERLGYFTPDAKDHATGRLVFNRTITLRDAWAGKPPGQK